MKDREGIIVEKALEVFRETTGLEAKWLTDGIGGGRSLDGIVRIALQSMEWKFPAEIRLRFNRAMVGLVKQKLIDAGKGLLVTDYVNPRLAEVMKDEGIAFIDAEGNAYIKEPPLCIFVKGNRPHGHIRVKPLKRLFKPGGLKVVFAMLDHPGMENYPYREIAAKAGVALGTVGWAIDELKDMGFLVEMDRGRRKLMNKTRLLERWVEAYPEQLRPKLIIERFEAGSRNWWEQIDIEGFGAFWGGEVAAFKLTGYLKPERITIYTKTNPGEMVLRNKLRKAPQGEVEILTAFWDFEKARQAADIAPPILVYADLMASGDQRNIETARIIYERYLDELVREDRQ